MTTTPLSSSAALECVRAILALAREQAVAIEREAIDRFDELLEARAALLSRLQVDSDAPAALSGPEALAIESVALEVIEQDRLNQAALGDRLRQVRTELPILAAGNRATTAYRQTLETAPAYVDRSS